MENREIIRDCLNSASLEELYKKIKKYANSEYTEEECYINILEYAYLNHELSYSFVIDVIVNGDEGKRNIILSNLELITYIDDILRNEHIQEYIINNFSSVLEQLSDTIKDDLIRNLIKSENGITFLQNEIVNNNLQSKIKGYTLDKIILKLYNKPDGIDFIVNNLEKIYPDGINYRDMLHMINHGVPEQCFIDKKNFLLEHSKETNFILLLQWLKEHNAIKKGEISLSKGIRKIYSDIDDETSLKTIEIFYKELLERQKMDFYDVEFIGFGRYNNVYKVGQFVVKVGSKRQTPIIQYNRRILQPLIRQSIIGREYDENESYVESDDDYGYYYSDIEEVTNNDDFDTFVEIQNLVDTKWYRGMTDDEILEELYKIYKEIRESGNIWTDIKPENVGRLLRRNTTNFQTQTLIGKPERGEPVYGKDGEIIGYKVKNPDKLKVEWTEMKVDNRAASIINNRDKEEPPLEAGELVILDTDYIFPLDTIDVAKERKRGVNYRYLDFEEIYLRELKEKKKNEDIIRG